MLEGGFADGVVDDGEATTVGEFFDARGEVFASVEDYFVSSGRACKSSLLFGGDGGEDAGAECLGHLDEEQAGAACTGVDEDLVATLDGIGGVGEVVGGDALSEGGGGLLRSDALGDGDEAGGGGDGKLSVGARDAAPGDVITGFECSDIGRNGDDGAGGLLPEGVREVRGVAAFAEVGVDEVDAGGFDANEGFAEAGSWSREIAEGEDVGGAGGKDLYGLHVDARVQHGSRVWGAMPVQDEGEDVSFAMVRRHNLVKKSEKTAAKPFGVHLHLKLNDQ